MVRKIVLSLLLALPASAETLDCETVKACSILGDKESTSGCKVSAHSTRIEWNEVKKTLNMIDIKTGILTEFDLLPNAGRALAMGIRFNRDDSPLQSLVVFNDGTFVSTIPTLMATLEYNPVVVSVTGRCKGTS